MTTKIWFVAALILGIGTLVAVTGYAVSKAGDKKTAVYSKMHRMINTKIIAEDGQVWGREEITQQGCDELIAEVTKGNLKDKEKLIGFLARWKAGDFSEAATEHNYIWTVLGGTDGKAVSSESRVMSAEDSSLAQGKNSNVPLKTYSVQENKYEDLYTSYTSLAPGKNYTYTSFSSKVVL